MRVKYRYLLPMYSKETYDLVENNEGDFSNTPSVTLVNRAYFMSPAIHSPLSNSRLPSGIPLYHLKSIHGIASTCTLSDSTSYRVHIHI